MLIRKIEKYKGESEIMQVVTYFLESVKCNYLIELTVTIRIKIEVVYSNIFLTALGCHSLRG